MTHCSIYMQTVLRTLTKWIPIFLVIFQLLRMSEFKFYFRGLIWKSYIFCPYLPFFILMNFYISRINGVQRFWLSVCSVVH
jgi:hypothetical protein